MMNYFPTNSECPALKAIGFDLDGTLYDEFDFIDQVYDAIATKISKSININRNCLHESLLNLWLEKGTSYPYIFDDTLSLHSVSSDKKTKVISECLNIFRNYKPVLHLPGRVCKLLEYLSKHYILFIVTDGGSKLQFNKYTSLGLDRWIHPANISISGRFPNTISKPDIRMNHTLSVFQATSIQPHEVLFYGDREVDQSFAFNSGFHFQKVKVMINIQ